METIQLDDGRFDLSSREFSIGSLALSQGSVAAMVNEQGKLNFQQVTAIDSKTRPVPAREKRSESSPWRVDFKSVGLDKVSLKYIDRSRAYPTEMGTASLGMKLKAHLSYGPEKTQAIVEDADIMFSDVSLKEASQGDPLVNLETLFVQGARLDLGARQLNVKRIALEGGHARVAREKEETINLARVFGGVGKGNIQKAVAAISEEAKDERKPWAVAVGLAEMTGFDVAFSDQTLSPSPTLDFENLSLKVSDIKSDLKAPLPFETSLTVRQGGSANAKGRLKLAEKSAEATVQVSNLALTPIQPYLAQVVLLTLDSGALSVMGKLNYKEGKNGPSTTFAGSMGLDNLHVSETGTGQRFLSWKKMDVNDVKLSLVPDRLEIGDIRLKEPYGKLIIYEDHSVSLKKVLRPQEHHPKPIKSAPQEHPPGGFPITVRKIQIEKGGLDFADLSLRPQFAAKIHELKGENQIILDKLTLGEKVDTPDAPDLPLELALALLKDADDRIDIGLPVSGNIDDPQFKYGHLIWKALLNLFKKIITAPFRALSAMLGVDNETLDVIEFEPGRTVVLPPEQEKVKNLSEALAKRPQLLLKIQGTYDPLGDGAAMKSLAVRHEIAKKTGRKVDPDEEPEPADVNDPLVQKAIEDLVRERVSPQALQTAREKAFKRAAATAKNGKKQAPSSLPEALARELYTSLLLKVIDAYPVTDEELKHLGRDRAEAVRQALAATGKVAEARLTVLEPSVAEEKGGQTVESKLTLDVTHGSANPQ